MHDRSDRALLELACAAAEDILTYVDAEDQSTNWAFDMVVEPDKGYINWPHGAPMWRDESLVPHHTDDLDRISVLFKTPILMGPSAVKRKIAVLQQILAQNPRDDDEVNNLIISELYLSKRILFAISIVRY